MRVVVFVVLVVLLGGGRADEPQVLRELSDIAKRSIRVRVEGLERDSAFLPVEVSCDGDAYLPHISWSGVEGAKAYAVFVVDPDAPAGDFYHLGAISDGELLSVSREQMEGWTFAINSGGRRGWFPVCPPRGHGVHRYYFVVVALNTSPQVGFSSVEELFVGVKRHAIAFGYTVGLYKM